MKNNHRVLLQFNPSLVDLNMNQQALGQTFQILHEITIVTVDCSSIDLFLL